jgi:hypothetical protein
MLDPPRGWRPSVTVHRGIDDPSVTVYRGVGDRQ